MTTDGLHTLIDPVAADVKVVSHLLTYLHSISENKHYSDDEFLQRTRHFLHDMKQYYNASRAHSVSKWMLFLRHLLIIVSETLYIKLSSDICHVAIETSITVPCKTKSQLEKLITRLNNVCSVVSLLQNEASEICENQRRGSENGHQRVALWDADMVALVMRSRQLQHMLEGCEVLRSSVFTVVETKAAKEKRFFNTLSVSIGAICAGNFAWNLWQGRSAEELLNIGVWSLCTGLSAAVLQIPRIHISDLTMQLQLHRKAREDVKEMSQNWLDFDDLSYAKLIRLPVFQKNGGSEFFGKAKSVNTNCR